MLDARECPGAYVTDGLHLYLVLDARQVRPKGGLPQWHVWLEDAITERIREFDVRDVCRMRLVRAAEREVAA